MTRLVLLVLLGLVSTWYFPESREALLRAVEPAVTPALRWHSANEMEEIVRELRLYEDANFGELPTARRFPEWLASNFEPATATDPWGGQYVLYVEPDSFAVVSFGPDALPRTDDDLRRAMARSRPGR